MIAYGEPTDAVSVDQMAPAEPDLDRLGAICGENGIRLLGPPGMLPAELEPAAL